MQKVALQQARNLGIVLFLFLFFSFVLFLLKKKEKKKHKRVAKKGILIKHCTQIRENGIDKALGTDLFLILLFLKKEEGERGKN